MAGPAIPGGEVIIDQLRTLGREAGRDSATIESGIVVQRAIYTALHTGDSADWKSARAQLRSVIRAQIDALPPAQRATVTDPDRATEMMVEQQLAQVRAGGEWFRRLVTYDPRPDLARLAVPVLALFGSLDTQVSPVLNREPTERALAGNRRATVRTIDSANHLFQPAITGAVFEYATLPKLFAPGFLPTLVGWVRAQTK